MESETFYAAFYFHQQGYDFKIDEVMEKLTLFVISLIFIHTVLLRDQYSTVAVSGKQKLSFAFFSIFQSVSYLNA